MDTYKTRENLKRRIIEAFASEEEIYHIHLFGREAEGCSDRYSDIDMVICSNDLARTKTKYPAVFDSISPVKATFCLEGTPHSYSEMIMLEDYSPYQKVDFTIGDEEKIDWPAMVSPILVVYENREQRRKSRTQLNEVRIKKDVGYKLNDILFSVPRFTKCLFRKDLDMYRRWESITNVTLAMLYEKHFGWEPETLKRRLGSYEIRCLYEVLTPDEKEQVHIIRPPDAKLDLALSYQTSIELFIELSKQKAEHFGVILAHDLIEHIRGFMDLEISRYQEQAKG